MTNPRDVNIDIVGHDKTDRATDSTVRNLDKLERKLAKMEASTRKVGFASDELTKKWAKHNEESGKFGDKIEKLSGTLLKVAAGAGAAVPALGALQPVIIGITTALAPAAAALGVFGGVLTSVFGSVSEASQKNQDLLDKMQLGREKAKVFRQRGDNESADKELAKVAKAAVELRARYNLLDPAQRQAVISMDNLKQVWQDFVDKNTPRVVTELTRAFDLLIRTIPKLQPLFDAGADAADRFLGFLERKEKDGTLDRLITWLTVNAGPGFDKVTKAIDGTWGALQVAWEWWGKLSKAVETEVDSIKVFVYQMRKAWYSTLVEMYGDSAEFLRNIAAAFEHLPGNGKKVADSLRQAAAGLDDSANKAREKANEIQASIDKIHGRYVDVRVRWTGTGEGNIQGPWQKSPGNQLSGTGQRIALASTAMSDGAPAGTHRTGGPSSITVSAPDVNVSVTIPGLTGALQGIVRTEVNRAMQHQAFRAQTRRAWA